MAVKDEWWLFHNRNKHVYNMFEKQAFRGIRAGRRRLSAAQIFDWMRWELSFTTTDKYKLNNNYRAFYARLFEHYNPEHKGIFEKRKMKNEK